MQNKIVFLDFDGVITSPKSRYKLDPELLERLGRILDSTGANIVVSSSWRRGTLEDTKQYLSTVSHYLPEPFPFVDKVIGITPNIFAKQFYIHRGVEIWNWINENKVDKYVILDDDSDMLLEQASHFVHTKTVDGLTEQNVEEAIKILNN
jgi:hypothetical protein